MRDLKLTPDKPAPCSECQGTGLCVRWKTFYACSCALGQTAGAQQWHEYKIHPDDFLDPRLTKPGK